MFLRARLKLTGWYLLIIMIVSLAFSGVIYRAAMFELNRFARAQQNRFESRTYIYEDGRIELHPSPPQFDETLLIEARERILKSLLFINLGIFGLAGLLGYYLSGRTLEPIALMIEEQYRFVSDASHELKTPITAMKSSLEVSLRDTRMTLKEAKHTLEVNLEEVNRLQKLAEELLELSSTSDLGNLEKANLKNIVEEAVKILDPIADSKNIKIVKAITPIIIMADKDSLRRAITMILENAIKYSEKGSKVRLSLKTEKKRVLLSIKDNGIGIDKDEIGKIFERFYRSDKARSTTGNGLGLAIAKKIVDQHSGMLKANSELGKGTTITIDLPFSARIQN